jgi:hypothetical protein
MRQGEFRLWARDMEIDGQNHETWRGQPAPIHRDLARTKLPAK